MLQREGARLEERPEQPFDQAGVVGEERHQLVAGDE